jgi:hypothetical protein
MNASVFACRSDTTCTSVPSMPPIAVTDASALVAVVEVAVPMTDIAERCVSLPMYVRVVLVASAVG